MARVIATAIRAADLVLIPVRHSGLDLWAVESLVESIQAGRLVADGRPGAVLGLPLQKVRTTHGAAYTEAIGYGAECTYA